jgi:hypothetical protein
MLTRHEEAQQLRKDKMMLDLAWDDQRQLDNDLRHARVQQNHAELYEQYTSKDTKQVSICMMNEVALAMWDRLERTDIYMSMRIMVNCVYKKEDF